MKVLIIVISYTSCGDSTFYAKCTYGQVADKYQLEKISQIPFLGDLAKTTAAGVILE